MIKSHRLCQPCTVADLNEYEKMTLAFLGYIPQPQKPQKIRRTVADFNTHATRHPRPRRTHSARVSPVCSHTFKTLLMTPKTFHKLTPAHFEKYGGKLLVRYCKNIRMMEVRIEKGL